MPSLRDLSLLLSYAARGCQSFPLLPLTPYTTTLPLRLYHAHTSSALQLADAFFSTPSLAGALFNSTLLVGWLVKRQSRRFGNSTA